MYITGLESFTNSRIKVYIDEEFAFILYPQDIRQYKLVIGEEIDDNLFLVINNDTVLRRAKNKAVKYLECREQSEKLIREKLARNYYTTEIIDKVIEFLQKYKYIDDRRFAVAYINSYASTKSQKLIRNELYIKGIKSHIIDDIFNEYSIDDNESLQKSIFRKLSRIDKFDYTNEKLKSNIINYFLRRGYRYNDIVKGIDEYYKIYQNYI